MTACYVCGADIKQDQPTVAARIITPGPGLVLACSAECMVDPIFAEPRVVIPTGTLTGEAKEHADRRLASSFRQTELRKLTRALNDWIAKAWRSATGGKA